MKLTPAHTMSNLLDVDMTAMIDVVFLLIIFFMTTAQFARMTHSQIDLPKEPGEARDEQAEPGVVVNLARDGSIIIDGQTVSMDRLANMVAAEASKSGADASDVKISIRADRNLSAGALNEIARSLARSGLRGVSLATDPGPGGGS